MARSKKDKRYQTFTCNGTMEPKLNGLIIKSGVHFVRNPRNIEEDIIGSKIFSSINFFRPHDIPEFVNMSRYNIGLTGLDMYLEWLAANGFNKGVSGLEAYLYWIAEGKYLGKKMLQIAAWLGISGNTNKAADIVICCKKGSIYDPAIIKRKERRGKKIIGKVGDIIDRKGVTVHSEYKAIADIIFKQARVVFSAGSTEAKVAKGLAHYGIVVRDTGKSLKRSGLVIAKVLFSSPMVLLAKKITPEIKIFGERLAGALEAEKYLFLEMHAPTEKTKDEILKILPAMRSPTVSRLEGSEEKGKQKNGWYSIKTVVEETEMLDLQVKLEKLKATDFVEYEIRVMKCSQENQTLFD